MPTSYNSYFTYAALILASSTARMMDQVRIYPKLFTILYRNSYKVKAFLKATALLYNQFWDEIRVDRGDN